MNTPTTDREGEFAPDAIRAAIANLIKGEVGIGISPEQLANISAMVTVDVLKEQFPLVSHLLEDSQAKFAAGFLSRINTLLNSPS